MEREYIVIVNRGVDLAAFDAEMADSQGHGPIPNRSVDVANPRPASQRMTHWMLTDEEAETLKTDPRVLDVEIPPDQRTDIQIGKLALQESNFFRGTLEGGVNWGLRRCTRTANDWLTVGVGTDPGGGFPYALDGTGVDVVIQDSGIQPDHPEWEDANGVSRLQQINWYTASGLSGTQNANHYRDYDGHGTHVASTAAGKIYGWAKNAHIYSVKVSGLEGVVGGNDSGTGISTSDCFDVIKEWHRKKNDPADPSYTGRPTVVNMSWGYGTTVSGAPTSGVFRGGSWTYTTETANDLVLSYGVMLDENGDNTGNRRLPVQLTSIDTDVEELIDAGVHVVVAAGNDYYKADIDGGTDYDNTVTFGGTTRFYHRPGSPYSTRAFNVGNISYSLRDDGGTIKDQSWGSSKKGPAVNIWAPGGQIMAAMSNINDGGTTYDYPDNASYLHQSLSGTSMAAPQVTGVIALHLQVKPKMSPEEMQNTLIGDSFENLLYDTGNSFGSYRALHGSPNRTLYSRYARQNPWSINRS